MTPDREGRRRALRRRPARRATDGHGDASSSGSPLDALPRVMGSTYGRAIANVSRSGYAFSSVAFVRCSAASAFACATESSAGSASVGTPRRSASSGPLSPCASRSSASSYVGASWRRLPRTRMRPTYGQALRASRGNGYAFCRPPSAVSRSVRLRTPSFVIAPEVPLDRPDPEMEPAGDGTVRQSLRPVPAHLQLPAGQSRHVQQAPQCRRAGSATSRGIRVAAPATRSERLVSPATPVRAGRFGRRLCREQQTSGRCERL